MQISQVGRFLFVASLLAGGAVAYLSQNRWPLYIAAVAGVYLLFALKVADQWEKVAVLRLGRYAGLRGPGLFHIIPIVDTLSKSVDQRVRLAYVTAESTLTRDTVPVNVDAIVFWVAWSPEKCILEVQDFSEAVTMSAQTGLRESIGRHELSQMITERESMGRELQRILDEKTNPWGITIQSVEIRDVRIPQGLEDAMSREAQAERERRARNTLSLAETEVAQKFADAAAQYQDNPVALHLRAMNLLYEAMKEKGSMIIVPSSAVETMGLGGTLATAALAGPRNPSTLRRMKILITILLSAVLAQGQTLPQKGVAEIDALFKQAIDKGTVPGLVAIVASKNQILYHNAFGLQDVANKKPMQKESIFRIASMTKPVTSASVMLLVEQGKLKLDDPVSKYLPEFAGREVVASFNAADGTLTTRKAAREVQIHDLLSNSSGLAYGFSNTMVGPLQQKTGKQAAEDLPLLYDPGTKWTYSGSTKVLGRVVEKISGTTLDKFMDENFLKPLGMNDTSYAVPAAKTARVVTTHNRATGKLVEAPNPPTIQSPVAGDGGLNSTAADYIKFLQMFLNDGKIQGKTLLSKGSIQAMTHNQIGSVVVDTQPAAQAITRPFPVAPAAGRDKFGFGFQLTTSNKENTNLRSAGSYTWAGIYNTHFWVDPKREIAAVLMIQVLPFYDDATMKLYQDFEEAIGKNLH